MSAARQLVDPYLKQEERAQQSAPQPKSRRKRLPATLKVCFAAACAVFLSLLYLQLQVISYNLNTELARLEEQVKNLEQRNDHLLLELESQRSLRQIEEIARKELGMTEPKRITTLMFSERTAPAVEEQSQWQDVFAVEAGEAGLFAEIAAWLNKVFPWGGVEAGTLQR